MPDNEPQNKHDTQQAKGGEVLVRVRAPWSELKINDRLTLTNTPQKVDAAQVDKVQQVAARHRVPITVKEN